MHLAEALETTRLPRVAGLTGAHTAVVTTRPCRAPHHTIADVVLIEGGQVPRPGEVSRDHYGVLFLDERPEFRRHGFEGLGQPLERGVVTIAGTSMGDRLLTSFTEPCIEIETQRNFLVHCYVCTAHLTPGKKADGCMPDSSGHVASGHARWSKL
jgi:magnesium chelatase family protein